MKYLNGATHTTTTAATAATATTLEDSIVTQKLPCQATGGTFMVDMSSRDDNMTESWNTTKVSMSSYVVTSSLLDEGQMEVLIDNERFRDPDIQARTFSIHRMICNHDDDDDNESLAKSSKPVTVTFIYGSEQDKTWDLFHGLYNQVKLQENQYNTDC
jgi:hypothetical protein